MDARESMVRSVSRAAQRQIWSAAGVKCAIHVGADTSTSTRAGKQSHVHLIRKHHCMHVFGVAPYLEWIRVRALRARVNQESVRASISALSCNQASRLAGPRRPSSGTEGDAIGVGTTLRRFMVHAPPRPPGPQTLCPPAPSLTSNIVLIGAVDLFYPPVAEGQLPHPVDAAPHSGGQAQVGTGGRSVEAVRAEVVRARGR